MKVTALFASLGVVAVLSGGSAEQAPIAVAGQATFTKDVAPILQRSCPVSHRPGSIAPMSMLTYDDARPWARAIKTQVSARSMPPWTLDKTVGIQHFKGD